MTNSSPLYLLERSDAGAVLLDRENKVIAMNSYARRVLPIEETQPFEKMVLSFHPERSQPKVKFLIDQSECPVGNPPPMTMIINIPERVLLIKVTRLTDAHEDSVGHVLIFYDITDAVSSEDKHAKRPNTNKRLFNKIPAVSGNSTVLIDTADVTYVRSEGHYTWITTINNSNFCNLSIGDLVERLDFGSFMRIHRSYIANLDYAEQILRDDGKISLRLRGEANLLPVSRTSVAELMERLGISATDATRS
jgi:hypothetical protein